MATANQIKANGYDRIKAMVDGSVQDGGPMLFGGVFETVERDLQSADPDEHDDRRDYFKTVEAIAQEALTEHPNSEEDRDTFVWESVDGSHYVIYYHAARQVLEFSDNDSAGIDEGIIDMKSCDSFNDLCTKMAFCAMRADIMENLSDLVSERDRAIEEKIEDATAAGADAILLVRANGPTGNYDLDLDGYLDALAEAGLRAGDCEIWAVKTPESDGADLSTGERIVRLGAKGE